MILLKNTTSYCDFFTILYMKFTTLSKGNNIFKRISDGAKTLYQKAKEFTPKFKQGKVGTIEVGGQQMSSQQAYEMVQRLLERYVMEYGTYVSFLRLYNNISYF